MKRVFQRAFDELKALGAPVFVRVDVRSFVLSAEENYDTIWADFYGEFGYQINPDVERVMDRHGLYLEWETAGALIAYEI